MQSIPPNYRGLAYGLAVLVIGVLAQSGYAAERAAWYSNAQVRAGESLFRQHCAVCHGNNAESTTQWRQPDAKGHYPPPPLNGSAHAWHHDLPLLRKTVREGGQKLGGLMPPFAPLLTNAEVDQVIAFFQSLWPDDIYQKWAQRFNVSATADSPPAPATGDGAIPNTDYLQKRLGSERIGEAKETTMPGIYQLKFGEKYLYLSADGEFAFIGDMIDLKNGVNLSKPKP